MPGLKKSEILRGRNLFKRTALTGKRLDGHLLRCMYLICSDGNAPLQVAFKVPTRNLNAVRRNRLKRLMREAVSQERTPLDSSLAKSPVRVRVMITYKGAKDIIAERVSLAQIRKDVEMFCRTISRMM